MNRRTFIKRGTLFVPTIFIPRLIRAQTILTADGLAAFKKKSAGGGGGGGGNSPFITSVSGGTTSAGANFDGGFKFLANAAITVTDLGRIVISGNSATHTVYLKNETCSSILASVSVNLSGQSAGSFVYSSITPVTLTSGVVYQVQSSEASGGDTYYNDNVSISTTSDGTITFSTYHDTACHVNTSGVKSYGVPNFKYHL